MEFITQWLEDIRQTYGVNPYIFGAIYVGATPLFWGFIYLLVRNLRRKKSITVPVIGMGLCAISSYVYLFIAGENLPLWVYGVAIALVGYGLYSVRKQAQKKKRQVDSEI